MCYKSSTHSIVYEYLGHNFATEACKPLAKLTSPDIIVGCNHFEPVKTLSNFVQRHPKHLEQVEEKAMRS